MKISAVSTSTLVAVAIAAPTEPCITSAASQNLNDPLLGSIEAVRHPLSTLINLVRAYQAADGLQGALGIQQSYYPLYTPVMSLSSAAANHAVASPNDVVAYGVGAGSIVVADITSLANPASAIESNLFTAIPYNAPCDQVTVAQSVASEFSSVFAEAAKAYKISSGIPSFPAAPTSCAVYC
ncbi:hypothetical protein B9G98_04174 [Wickerhamiella sorbophila]|uniref:Uncharacterized protein n=1 Tax=Wickerhamiella sorbophila TaxID=45607 RepID=A0A2T0FNJ5_9ASCO|nr:hypothetical protein B9G98_04174 [Wickerhamiella sorbophila]PRT56554.1 hypothetical protein B9G98_04174 [Wickerhamiella sorbophila]